MNVSRNCLPRKSILPKEGTFPGFFVMPKSLFLYLRLHLVAIACFAIVLPACEEGETDSVDFAGIVPQLSAPSVQPDSINVDTLTAAAGMYSIHTIVNVNTSDSDGDLAEVTARILRDDPLTPIAEASLHDDGVAPDQSAGDGVFSGEVEFSITRAEAGPYRIQFLASDSKNLTSNTLEATLFATRRNSIPFLDATSLIAPDTVVVPVGGFASFTMSIAAQDSDGLADIQSVFFLSPDGANPDFRFPLQDDGNADPNLPSGDSVAGDGVFSILLGITDSPTIRGAYRLFFQAEDSFGDTSTSVLHLLTIE
jgi:hypothetical protein